MNDKVKGGIQNVAWPNPVKGELMPSAHSQPQAHLDSMGTLNHA